MTVAVIVGLSVVVQLAAAVLAVRMNFAHGWRWAWSMISIALLVMTVRRGFNLYLLISGDVGFEPDDWIASAADVTSASASLIASCLMLAGVSLIDPLFQEIAAADEVLRGTNLKLQQVVRHTEAELQIAQTIQKGLFPDSSPRIPGFDISGNSLPAEFAGGDYFDWISTPAGRVAFVVADVGGHGVGAALLMAEIRAFLRALMMMTEDPSEILTCVNRLFFGNPIGARYVTLFLASLDFELRNVVYSGAGHSGYLLRANGEYQSLDSTGFPIGILEDTEYFASSEIALETGDVLLLMTDGVSEASLPDGTRFGVGRVLDIIRSNRNESAKKIVDTLFREVRIVLEGMPQQDDRTVLVAKVLN